MHQGIKHTIKHNGSYYLTTTIVEWLDALKQDEYKKIIIGSLKYCIKAKGLNVYAYVIMNNHMHMVVNCNEPFQLKDTIRDLKRFTSKKIIAGLLACGDATSVNMLEEFEKAGSKDKKNKTYKVWQTGNHALEVHSEKFAWQKINYIHNNPVRAGLVGKQEDHLFSSAQNYFGYAHTILDEVYCLPPMLQTF